MVSRRRANKLTAESGRSSAHTPVYTEASGVRHAITALPAGTPHHARVRRGDNGVPGKPQEYRTSVRVCGRLTNYPHIERWVEAVRNGETAAAGGEGAPSRIQRLPGQVRHALPAAPFSGNEHEGERKTKTMKQ